MYSKHAALSILILQAGKTIMVACPMFLWRCSDILQGMSSSAGSPSRSSNMVNNPSNIPLPFGVLHR